MHKTTAFSGGFMYSPTTSMTLASNSGSVENLNVSSFHGLTPYSRHVRATVEKSIRKCLASNRADQCVTPSFFGGGFKVAVMIFARLISRGRPDRSRSSNPASPAAWYRFRQAVTVGTITQNQGRSRRMSHAPILPKLNLKIT